MAEAGDQAISHEGPMSDLAGLKEGVKRIGESEPLIQLGLTMGRVVDTATDLYKQGKEALRRRVAPPRDIALPKERRKPTRKVAPIQRSLMRGR